MAGASSTRLSLKPGLDSRVKPCLVAAKGKRWQGVSTGIDGVSASQPMNIGELAKVTGVSADTLRYYEKQALLDAPARRENGYRAYVDAHVERVRFIRGAQGLGFSLAEIQDIIPRLSDGTFGRADIEQRLMEKMAQIDAHMQQLAALRNDLATTFASLACSVDRPVSMAEATPLERTLDGIDVVGQQRFRGKK